MLCARSFVFFFGFWSCGRNVLNLLVINLTEKKETSKTKIVQLVNRRNIIQIQTNLKGPLKVDRTSSSSRILRDRRWSSFVFLDIEWLLPITCLGAADRWLAPNFGFIELNAQFAFFISVLQCAIIISEFCFLLWLIFYHVFWLGLCHWLHILVPKTRRKQRPNQTQFSSLKLFCQANPCHL